MAQLPLLDHLIALSDDVGIIQHAVEDVPNRATGYCTDDVARAFMVAIAATRTRVYGPVAQRLAGIYLAFLHDAQVPDGRFHNFMGYDRNWQDGCGTEDSFGRALWGLGYGMQYAPRESWRRVCGMLVDRALAGAEPLVHLRANAYAALGLVYAVGAKAPGDGPHRDALARSVHAIRHAYGRHASTDWRWCETTMTYDNGRLCEALIRGGAALGERSSIDAGLAMLDFYASVVIEDGMFVPVGNDGWFPRGGERSRSGEQPLEAAALVDAGLAAFDATGEARYAALADTAFAWFLGRNSRQTPLAVDGGCRDGIDPHGVNANMGAESTLAYLASAFTLEERAKAPLRIAK